MRSVPKTGQYITLENYITLKDEMKSFDLLMFRGDDVISDTIAEIQNNDNFTHAGLIIHPSLLPNFYLDPNKLYILESTFSYEIAGMDNGPADVITGERFFGGQLRDLESVCNSYIKNEKTKITWIPLKLTPNITDFSSIFQQYHKRPFLTETTGSFIDAINFKQITPEIMLMAKSFLTTALLQTILKSAFSCVKLVTSIYHEIGISIDSAADMIYPCELLTLI